MTIKIVLAKRRGLIPSVVTTPTTNHRRNIGNQPQRVSLSCGF